MIKDGQIRNTKTIRFRTPRLISAVWNSVHGMLTVRTGCGRNLAKDTERFRYGTVAVRGVLTVQNGCGTEFANIGLTDY